MKVPVTVYSEMTPNPVTMKFVVNKHLLPAGESVEFNSYAEAKGYSPLAEELFQFPFVKGFFMASNFITITKTDALSWDIINMEVREFIKNWIGDAKDVLVQMPAPKAVEPTHAEQKEYAPSEYDEAIIDLLDQYVRPAVEGDGGAIDFRSYHEGVVTVALRGACSGCPSSTATLKGGIENLLKQHLPEVKEVIAENA